MLNKHDVVPLYAQLERILREKILTGEFKDGDPIPSEAELTKTYNITRTTVRKAIGNLVQEGIPLSSSWQRNICKVTGNKIQYLEF